jgi:hypothetical protein
LPGVAASTSTQIGTWAQILTVVLSIITGAAVAFDQVLKDGVRWRLYRHTYTEMMREGWAFFAREGDYRELDEETRLARLFSRTEAVLAGWEAAYSSEVAGVVDHQLQMPSK